MSNTEQTLSDLLIVLGMLLYVWATAFGIKEIRWLYYFGVLSLKPILLIISWFKNRRSAGVLELSNKVVSLTSGASQQKTRLASEMKQPSLRTKKKLFSNI